MDDEDDIIRKYQRRRKSYLYGSFLVCLAGAALVASGMATQSWVTADAYPMNITEGKDYHGDFRAGLFQGKSTLVTAVPTTYDYYTVCDQGECLYSCAASKEQREKHLDLILSGNADSIESPPCLDSSSKTSRSRRSASSLNADADQLNYIQQPLRVVGHYAQLLERSLGLGDRTALEEISEHEGVVLRLNSGSDTHEGLEPNQALQTQRRQSLGRGPPAALASLRDESSGTEESQKSNDEVENSANIDVSYLDLASTKPHLLRYSQVAARDADEVSETDGLMSQGLWVGTIACLSGGLLFALVGAVFAIVNTATTPIEAITGVTGLYIWNGLAATFDLVAVILWSVMFSSRLSSNVLVEQSSEGWTTEGYETLGYSFWLVVVAIFLHVGNCGLIAYGTREPKLKEELQEPENVTNDILLY